MKKNIQSLFFTAIFVTAYTFAVCSCGGSGNSNGMKDYTAKCCKCGYTWTYQKDSRGNGVDMPKTINGEQYCRSCYSAYKNFEKNLGF